MVTTLSRRVQRVGRRRAMARKSGRHSVLSLMLAVLGLAAALASLALLSPWSQGARGQEAAFDIALSQGWNLISLPLVPDDSDSAAVLASISDNLNVAWAYDPSLAATTVAGAQPQASPWLSYDPDLPGPLNSLGAIHETMGFWLNMKAPDPLTVTGTEPGSTDISIFPDWNFIGYPASDARPVADVLAGIPYNSAWAYDPLLAPSPWQSHD